MIVTGSGIKIYLYCAIIHTIYQPILADAFKHEKTGILELFDVVIIPPIRNSIYSFVEFVPYLFMKVLKTP